MLITIENILTMALILFSVIDMPGNIPLIINLRKNSGKIHSLKASIYAVLIMIIALFLGKYLFRFLGIEISHFAMAGSLLIAYYGWNMITGKNNSNTEELLNATVFPVAFPLIAGPGTLSTILSFKTNYLDYEIVIAIIINAIIIFIILKSASWIESKIGKNGINIIERFFGFILLSIAFKMFIENYNIVTQNL